MSIIKSNSTEFNIKKFGILYPIFSENTESSGVAKGHYYHQDLYFANLIYRDKPRIHFDVGSRIDGFISHLLSFEQKLLIGDIRKSEIDNSLVKNIYFDLSKPLKRKKLTTYTSISCLHAIEHVGLGRYGDQLDPLGHLKALKNLSLILKKEGILYLSHPTSKESEIYFNAHRVISLKDISYIFSYVGLKPINFAYVDNSGLFHAPISPDKIDYLNNFGLNYGCALWCLKKI
ncbi:DUF268 domain-containing protein [Prochlorococcus marinus]|uniref:DUF268 domain-containing protein n=1 Tax=Prochlorococcus marinus TaxID=1219 RepID=UPI001ADAAE2B|nr:DUF268 domain-containing protein [Prochlorococcus marinus]MBO8219552.1 DUF268 domain-containing protein [Prochlorococcus marinus CUG1416]